MAQASADNGGAVVPGQAARVESLVARRVAANPAGCAVLDREGRVLTYGQLWEESGRLAETLAAMEIGGGSFVAIALDRSAEMVVAMLGVARSGAAYVLLDPQSPAGRNALIVAEVAASAIVEGHDPAPWSPPGPAPRVRLPLGRRQATEVLAPPGRDLEQPLYVAYTSGSTGRPKGVIASHRAVIHFVTQSNLCHFSSRDQVASLSNPASDATTLEIWQSLVAGAAIVVLPAVTDPDVPDWPLMLRASGVSVMFMMAGLVDLISAADPGAFAALDTLIFGGEALNPRTLQRIDRPSRPRRLVLGYGPTETTVFATSYDCDPELVAERDRIPLGFALRGYRLSVLGEDSRPVRDGEVGELYIGGPGVASGYLARPEMTAQRFVPLAGDPAGRLTYKTGDLVRTLPGGALEFAGRVDRQVKLRGYRIELEEVEYGILATGLVETAVVDRVDDPRGAHLVCFYVPRPGPSAAGGTDLRIRLAAAVQERLPGYMIPARWIAVDSLPRTTIGKVDRARLTASLADGSGQARGPVDVAD